MPNDGYSVLSEALKHRFTSLASELAAHVDEVAAVAIARIRAEVPQFAVGTPELADALASGAQPSILTELVAMQQQAALPEACPAVDAEGARLAARFGVPLATAIWVYRVGQRAQWESWYRLVDRAAIERADRVALHEAGSRFFFDYADRMSSWVTAEYTNERDLNLRSREQKRTGVVRELLTGGEPDLGVLDYDVEAGTHLAVVASGQDVATVLRELARKLDRRLLDVAATGDVHWAWLGGREPLDTVQRDLLERWRPPASARVASGPEGQGLPGFRASHEGAILAHRIGLARERPMTHFESVSLEVLALGNVAEARRFVTRELGSLNRDSTRAERLRSTLGAYLDSGHNATATAAKLGIHEQTVANRLRALEQELGITAMRRATELATALRLREVL